MVTNMELLESTNTKALKMTTEKQKLLTVNGILSLISRSNDKFSTVHNFFSP
jgi:hypothetical protein